jgi:hypothetical protein
MKTELDAEENVKRLVELRKKLLEAIEYTYTPEEIEARKRSATETPIQGS